MSMLPADKYSNPVHDRRSIDPMKGLDPSWFPGLNNHTSAHIFDFAFHPADRRLPEFVYVPFQKTRDPDNPSDEDAIIYKWDMEWEIGQMRSKIYKHRYPLSLAWLDNYPDTNLYLLPDSRPRYEAYAPLYHLLPAKAVIHFGLPIFGTGYWPITVYTQWWLSVLTQNFEEQLSQAFANHIWPLLNPRSQKYFFSKDDPIVILSHNLDFWLPYAYQVIENRLRQFPRCEMETPEQMDALWSVRRKVPPGVIVDMPLKGGDIWRGEADAHAAAQELVAAADSRGKLRAIIDAVLSNRCHDDFSPIWGAERIDFERKFYHTRSKVKVAFVELPETLPVHAPDTQISENLMWQDFFAVLDKKEQKIVVCLRNGYTKHAEIAQKLGYANHSSISKALQKIQAKATMYLES